VKLTAGSFLPCSYVSEAMPAQIESSDANGKNAKFLKKMQQPLSK
jgi:hypothetical protein